MDRKSIEIKVRGYHLDMFQHVNNARYLEFLEEARWHLFEDVRDSTELEKATFFVVNINISYLHPATLGAILVVECKLKSINRKSWILSQRIKIKEIGTPIADADITLVAVDRKSGKSVLIDVKLRSLIKSLFA